MNAFDPVASRQQAWQKVTAAGFRINPSLPPMESSAQVRPIGEVAQRVFCLLAVAAYSHGFPLRAAQLWLDRENLASSLSRRERELLAGSRKDLVWGRVQINPLYVLSWCTSLVQTLDLEGNMPDDLVDQFPDLRKPESSDAVRSRMSLRSDSEIQTQRDFAYCLHWAWRDATLTGNRKLPPDGLMVIAERRKALEWIVDGGDWNEVSLDT